MRLLVLLIICLVKLIQLLSVYCKFNFTSAGSAGSSASTDYCWEGFWLLQLLQLDRQPQQVTVGRVCAPVLQVVGTFQLGLVSQQVACILQCVPDVGVSEYHQIVLLF